MNQDIGFTKDVKSTADVYEIVWAYREMLGVWEALVDHWKSID